MGRVPNAPIIREIHNPDEKWLRCIAHLLNNGMKSAMTLCSKCDVLLTILLDFNSLKRIIEDVNRAERKHLLPDGSKMKQECETRFEAYYYVAERFMKSRSRIACHIDYRGETIPMLHRQS